MREIEDRMIPMPARLTRVAGIPFFTVECPCCGRRENVMVKDPITCQGCGAHLQPEKQR